MIDIEKRPPGGVSSNNFAFGIGIVVDMATTTRRGRRPKGRRAAFTVKVPENQKPLLEEAARKAGLPLCDYVAVVLANHHGYEAPDYLEPHDKHPELPISA